MTPEQIEVTAVSATWNPEAAAEAIADVRKLISAMHAANADALEGIQRFTVEVGSWGLHIYCEEGPNDYFDDWESEWVNKFDGDYAGQYDLRRFGYANWQDESDVDYSLHALVGVLHRIVSGAPNEDDAEVMLNARIGVDAVMHPQIDDIVNAIAFHVHQRKEGKS